MAVSSQEFTLALGRFLSLQAVASNGQGEITVVTVEIDGIRGSGGRWRNRPVRYRLLIDVSSLPPARLPTVWVLDPPDSAITHVNIFRAAMCPLLGTALPHLCWGNFPAQWVMVEESRRTLARQLVESTFLQHLNHLNLASRAR